MPKKADTSDLDKKTGKLALDKLERLDETEDKLSSQEGTRKEKYMGRPFGNK